MAVAVKNTPEVSTESARGSLASASLMGALYVLASLVIVAVAVPKLWASGISGYISNSFVNAAGLIVVELFVLGLLAMFGMTLAGSPSRPGLKAGVFTIVAIVIAALALLSLFANGTSIGDIAAVIAAGLVAVIGFLFVSSARFDARMQQFENQGWFTAAAYKPNQGRKVRRATMLGLLIIAAAGIWTLIEHRTLDAVNQQWRVAVPFNPETKLTLLPDIKYTVPLVLAAAAFWFSYRIVNMPTFAEFLIATDSELTKVAWPTKRSLIQDTIVVLTTVILLTVFLFLVDVAWGKILGSPWIGVLRLDSDKPAVEAKELKEIEW